MYRCVFPHSEVEYDYITFSSIEKAQDYVLNLLEDSAVILNENDTVTHIMFDFEWHTIH